ncbi:MAG: mcrA [Glaciihabitans sp.]|nr:mcrA [Glaciihabitans sp.]
MADTDVSELRRDVSGPVLTPGDPGFAAEVAGWDVLATNRPDVVVGVTHEGDVAAAVRFARDRGLRVTVQASGHGASGPITSGVLITTGRLNGVSVDPVATTATIDAGVSWQAVIDASAPHGLIPIAGSSTTVGVVGYLLGGGLGPLSRSHGFSSDYLRSLTVVTSDGEIVEASADSNSDLFWALRGGKVGFGIVVSVRLALVRASSLYAGSLLFDGDDIEPALRGWIDYTATAPDSVTTSIAIMRLPDIPLIPAPLRGHTLLSLRFAYLGDAAEGASLAKPLRALAPVYLDAIASMPLVNVALIHGDPTRPMPSLLRGGMLDRVDQDLATAVLEAVGPHKQVPIVAFELRHLGGATHRDVPEGSAVGGRAGNFTVMAISVPDPSLFETVVPAAINGVFAAISPWASTAMNINFLATIPNEAVFASAWPAEMFTRLTEIRRRWDPAGIFSPAIYADESQHHESHGNAGITPAQ